MTKRPVPPHPPSFTAKQGQYLAYIDRYTQLHGRSPAEAELRAFFGVSPPSVHQMILTLEGNGLISRIPGQARAIRVLVAREDLPPLEASGPSLTRPGGRQTLLRHPLPGRGLSRKIEADVGRREGVERSPIGEVPSAPPELDVLCLGRACVDQVLEVEAYPAEDAKVLVLDRLREGGGQASTAACLAAHLGGRAGFVGVLGDDEAGRFARERMAAFGVDLSALPPPRGRTPTAWCLVSRARGTRTIVYEPSAPERLAWEEVRPAAEGARAVLVDRQGEHLLADLAPFCREQGILTVADAERAEAGWEETWGLVDVLAVSRTFLEEAAPGLAPEDALRAVAGRARGWCCATLGAEGALALLEGEILRIPALRVPVRDTTGAGDVFHGALALALIRGRPRGDALRYAVTAASLSCRGLGGRSFSDAGEVGVACSDILPRESAPNP